MKLEIRQIPEFVEIQLYLAEISNFLFLNHLVILKRTLIYEQSDFIPSSNMGRKLGIDNR